MSTEELLPELDALGKELPPPDVAPNARSTLSPRVVSSRLRLGTRIADIWRSRELLRFLIRKELKVKYKNSFLGFFWSMLNPAVVLAVYFVVFRFFMKSGIHSFALFLFCGLLVWNLFGSALNSSAASIVANAGIVKKVSFPREILPLAQVGTSVVFFFFQSLVMVGIFMVGFHHAPAWGYLPVLFYALAVLILLAAAFSLFLSAVNVYFRDVQHLIEVLLQAWFWGVPIIYSYNTVYNLFARHHLIVLARLYLADPITPIVLSFQRALYGDTSQVFASPIPGQKPLHVLAMYPYHTYIWMLSADLGAAIVLLLGAMAVFGRIGGNFAEELERTMPAAIEIQDVSKRFRLYHEKYSSLKERVLHAGHIPYEEFWAVNGVSAEIEAGKTVGILGRNGSGKSTLLKCIAGILQPTSGQVVVRGQVAAMLELGAGFQPELSGRDNIYLNGSLLGLSRREIDRRFDDIVGFAELEQFIDNQVKFYSSGMYVRLGFSVAVNTDPDVLLVDEVLAVGDERFQQKCLNRVKEFHSEGRTIVVVSHSADLMRQICDEILVIEQGRLVTQAPPGEAIRAAREALVEAGVVPGEHIAGNLGATTGPVPIIHRAVEIGEVTLDMPEAEDRPYVRPGEPISVRVEFDVSDPIDDVSFGLTVISEQNVVVFAEVRHAINGGGTFRPGTGSVTFHFAYVPLLDGHFTVNIDARNEYGIVIDLREPACTFDVVNSSQVMGGVFMPFTIECAPPAPRALGGVS